MNNTNQFYVLLVKPSELQVGFSATATITSIEAAANMMALDVVDVRHHIEEFGRCDTEFLALFPLEPV